MTVTVYSIGNSNLTLVENTDGEWRLTSQKTDDQVVTFATARVAQRFLLSVQKLAPDATLHVTSIQAER